MSKQIAFLLTGLSLAVSSVGCCCLGGYGRSNQCGCPTGTPGNTYYPPQTTMTQTFDGQAAYSSGLTQTAYSSGPMQTAVINNGAIAGPPIMASPGGYTTTVMVPANSLPTY